MAGQDRLARPGQLGRLERGERDEDAGGQHRHGHRFAGDLFERANDRECGLAELHLAADLHAELLEQRLLDDRHVAAGAELGHGIRGRGHEITVEGESPGHRTDLHEARVAGGGRKHRHRRKHLVAGDVAQRGDVGLQPGAERIARLHHEVGAEEALGLILDRLAQVTAERADGDERGDAEHHGQRKQREPLSRCAGIPPGHGEDEVHRLLPEVLTADLTDYTDEGSNPGSGLTDWFLVIL